MMWAEAPSTSFLDEFQRPDGHGWRDLETFLDSCEPALRAELGGHDITLDRGYVRVSGGISLWRKPVHELPEFLWVEKHLDLEGTLIERLPPNLHVGQDLNLASATRKLSPDLFVGGDLNLMYSRIRSLPENTMVMGDVCVELSPLARSSDDEIRSSARIYGAIHR